MNAPSGIHGLPAINSAIAAYEGGDYATALNSFRQLAEQGDALAQFHLGRMHSRGEGTPQDHTAAALWYRRSADQGNLKAQHNLASMYQTGEGVPLDLAE